ncbi:carbohydrate kinase family protein [Pleomorphovibrio marinus]|uniref:carbohydrate kinase family protein n=1 Tax=Pleomorphovibrio marinus TaxID=2164132 RepID=UPI000E0A88E7|nr:carbohydrate kinase [Pleomorphovibrio marinus]
MPKNIICYGEMLWDVFPKDKIPGGAPMNVALHLQHLGHHVAMFSAIGEDKMGKKLLAFVEKYGVKTDYIQRNKEYPTGTVLVDDSDKENIKYDIVKPSAWDYIAFEEKMIREVQLADCFIFGSLAVRNQTSKETLFRLLQKDVLKVLDINLRPPHYTPELLEQLLEKADILKINEEELTILADYLNLPSKVPAALEKLSESFDIDTICVTLGAKGAMLYTLEELVTHPGYPVTVKDSVGAGDAFLAGFVIKYLEKESPEIILDYACALGALVASLPGGTPEYKPEQIEQIRKNLET